MARIKSITVEHKTPGITRQDLISLKSQIDSWGLLKENIIMSEETYKDIVKYNTPNVSSMRINTEEDTH